MLIIARGRRRVQGVNKGQSWINRLCLQKSEPDEGLLQGYTPPLKGFSTGWMVFMTQVPDFHKLSRD